MHRFRGQAPTGFVHPVGRYSKRNDSPPLKSEIQYLDNWSLSMRKPTLIASLALIVGLGALGPVAQAVEKTGDALEHSPSNGRRLVENDRVPADYQRADRAMKDWKQKKLEQPTNDQQWVHIDDKYLLIETVSGAIVKIVPATR
jgi:hypothetical protein